MMQSWLFKPIRISRGLPKYFFRESPLCYFQPTFYQILFSNHQIAIMSNSYEQITSVASADSVIPARFSLRKFSRSRTVQVAIAVIAGLFIVGMVFDSNVNVRRMSNDMLHYMPSSRFGMGSAPVNGIGMSGLNYVPGYAGSVHADMHADMGFDLDQAGTIRSDHASNACAEEAHGVCYGPIRKPAYMAVRQCTHGYYATRCKCFTNGGAVVSELLVGPRCFCRLSTQSTHDSTWAMYLFCKKGEHSDTDSESRFISQPMHPTV